MKTLLSLLVLIFLSACASPRPVAVTSAYQELKQYEGLYEYLNNTRLHMAASPKDNKLYAIIDETKYPLNAVRKNVFTDGMNTEVLFERDASQQVIGWRYPGKNPERLYKQIAKESLSEKIWYPRLPVVANFDYKYQMPKATKSGLPVADLPGMGINPVPIAQMMNKIVDGTYKNIDSVLIIKDGKLVLEEYFYQFDQDKLHEQRSATKSVVSALVGIAIDKGFIKNSQQTVVDFFPEYELKNLTEDKKKITIQDLLTNQSGLDCDDWNQASPGQEQKMYESEDWVKFILDLPMAGKPESRASYCTGGVIVLGRIVEKATEKKLAEFADSVLFKPLGVTQFGWDFNSVTSGMLKLTPVGMAKFGLLYLNGGRYEGQQIISDTWVKASLTKHSTIGGINYGYLWWLEPLNAQGENVVGMAAKGNGGQRIYIWPELNAVTVITGSNYNSSQSSSNYLLQKYVLPSLISMEKKLPEK
jgi:CubicO group peptidase (beta-lactamase class C family)